MSDDNQSRFLGNVRRALGLAPETKRSSEGLHSDADARQAREILETVSTRTAEARQGLLQRLVEVAKPIKLQVIQVKDIGAAASAIAQLVTEKDPEWGTAKRVAAWKHPLIDALDLPQVLAALNVPVFTTEMEGPESVGGSVEARREEIRRQVLESYIGVTSADFCVAETGTLVLKTRPNQARAVSLLPSIHVAVIRLEQVLASLKELYAVLKWDPVQKQEGLTNCMTLISGPSKTADIELVMVHGAHGPRELYLYVITELNVGC